MLISLEKKKLFVFSDQRKDQGVSDARTQLAGQTTLGWMAGYNRRFLVETVFSSLKRLFGNRSFSKTIGGQMVESRS
ncbi:hypothetical protein [Parachlamydia sp. AcF125]|uniref:hypothetical protein n=1 Tax=Parachlamydia sp. AcF125 TaxID=2795736 RepID=UPI001BC8DF5D|nr:hypothetical protein [Parachlamydia sp. AcF125]